ncbi:hypothetical protein DSCO28_35000 [Desulfosarcina ovata subsp. sediminis]|uniref:Uncharacterized protein n=1 Tax=Desulfosarcina ovata subsp. sediminis TaxID=885957 RepID=A0A5K7ZMW3_9BACT|nr:hypothetical protein DSCO28_35000 [Desulfosarcina ovata subsp. sediminis]
MFFGWCVVFFTANNNDDRPASVSGGGETSLPSKATHGGGYLTGKITGFMISVNHILVIKADHPIRWTFV